MSRVDEYIQRLRQLAGADITDEIERELRTHLAEAAADFEHAGLSTDEAERRAISALGNEEEVARAYRENRLPPFMSIVNGPIEHTTIAIRRDPILVTALAVALAFGSFLFSLALPATYQAHEAMQLVGSYDYGRFLVASGSVNQQFDANRSSIAWSSEPWADGNKRNRSIPLSIDVSDSSADGARALVQHEAGRATVLVAGLFAHGPNGDMTMALVPRGEPAVAEIRLISPITATAIGALIGAFLGVMVVARRGEGRL